MFLSLRLLNLVCEISILTQLNKNQGAIAHHIKQVCANVRINIFSFHVRFCQASFVTFFQFFLYSKHNSPYPCNHRCRFLPKSKLIVSLFLFFKKTFSSTSHRQRVSHRSQPSIDRERSRHSPIICHMRKTCEFEVSVLRCRMQSATRSFIELPLCSKISFLFSLIVEVNFSTFPTASFEDQEVKRVDSP